MELATFRDFWADEGGSGCQERGIAVNSRRGPEIAGINDSFGVYGTLWPIQVARNGASGRHCHSGCLGPESAAFGQISPPVAGSPGPPSQVDVPPLPPSSGTPPLYIGRTCRTDARPCRTRHSTLSVLSLKARRGGPVTFRGCRTVSSRGVGQSPREGASTVSGQKHLGT